MRNTTTGEAIFEAIVRKIDEAAARERRGEAEMGDDVLSAMRRGLVRIAVESEVTETRAA